MNVGSDPPVMPLIRCRVVVGGSANAVYMNDRSGCLAVSSAGNVRTLWWCGEGGCGGSGEMKSKRSASMMSRTVRLYVAGQCWFGVDTLGKDRRVRRNPRVYKYMPAKWMRNTHTSSRNPFDAMSGFRKVRLYLSIYGGRSDYNLDIRRSIFSPAKQTVVVNVAAVVSIAESTVPVKSPAMDAGRPRCGC